MDPEMARRLKLMAKQHLFCLKGGIVSVFKIYALRHLGVNTGPGKHVCLQVLPLNVQPSGSSKLSVLFKKEEASMGVD